VKTPTRLTVNGRDHQLDVDVRMRLVDLLRDELRLTGTHVGCSTGNCGACTVVLSGRTVKSCCVLAVDADGESVTTIEALSTVNGLELHPIQRAFVEHQGLYARHDSVRGTAARGQSASYERRDSRRDRRQPVPVYWLPANRRIDPLRR
jgi:succinate dehydrogenase/fumarate reductase-like Fe-S protein